MSRSHFLPQSLHPSLFLLFPLCHCNLKLSQTNPPHRPFQNVRSCQAGWRPPKIRPLETFVSKQRSWSAPAHWWHGYSSFTPRTVDGEGRRPSELLIWQSLNSQILQVLLNIHGCVSFYAHSFTSSRKNTKSNSPKAGKDGDDSITGSCNATKLSLMPSTKHCLNMLSPQPTQFCHQC